MSEINYSKKQIEPLVLKFQINTNTNDVFKSIIALFDGQTNYQVWAIKLVFSGICTYETIALIKEWADTHQTEIKHLIKGNIISYKNNIDITNLMNEIRGLDLIANVKNSINKFNTEQRNMLKEHLLTNINNGLEANSSSRLKKWASIFAKMETLVKHRKEKLISTASAITDISFLKNHIESALLASYEWNRDDMLSFMSRNASDCNVVYDGGEVVVINVPSFTSSKLLCGNGRTGWCLTREERYFNQYVKEPRDAKQYFLFDFSLREDDELAHIGFTVRKGAGIVNAHSTKNYSLIGEGISYNNKRINITKALMNRNVPCKIFLPLKELTQFKWNAEDFIKFVGNNPQDYAISVFENNRVVVNVLNNGGLQKVVGHTYINVHEYDAVSRNKIYLILDFNLEFDDNKSITLVSYVKDNYNTYKLSNIMDIYNTNVMTENYFESINMPESKFFCQEKIDPKILLHKFIDEGKENEAINLIAEEGDSFDVNFEFNQSVPVFNAIDKKMFNLFDTIVNHKNFDCNTCDSFGESLLQSLLFNYLPNNSGVDKKENEAIKRMIISILNSENFDFNVQDINLDTAINIACDRKELLWVVEALASKPNVNINIVNDFNCTALGTAIRRKNINAIKILATRKDLVVREEDLELAKANNIKLEAFLNPELLESVSHTDSDNYEDDLASDLSKIFAEAFGARK